MTDSKNSKSKDFDTTLVDLGEDLLRDKTSSKILPQPENISIESLLAFAKIQIQENLLDDAKKSLRRVLSLDPNNLEVKKLWEKIVKVEVKDLLSDKSPKRDFSKQEEESVERIIENLEKDFKTKITPEISFKLNLDSLATKAKNLSPKEKIDLGVGLMEMQLYQEAELLFEIASKVEVYRNQAIYLYCLALILSGNAVEATVKLAPIVQHLTIEDKENELKDFLYLMAMAFEKLDDKPKAKHFYKKVFDIDPYYRSTSEKMRKLK